MFPLSLTSRRPTAPAPVLQALLRLHTTATAARFWPCAHRSRGLAGWWSLNCRLKRPVRSARKSDYVTWPWLGCERIMQALQLEEIETWFSVARSRHRVRFPASQISLLRD